MRLLLLQFLSFCLANFEIPSSCNQAGQIALTFDDGPSLYTGELLKILAKEDVKVAFHIKVDYLSNPVLLAYVRSAIQEGHIVGLVISQNDLRGVSKEAIKKEIEERAERVQKLTNYKVKYLRLPYMEGGVPDLIFQTLVEDMGYELTSFNLDSKDYMKGLGPDGVVQGYKESMDKIVPPAKGSFISVQRDIIQESVQQTEDVIKYITGKGYQIVRLDTCIGKGMPKSGDIGRGAATDGSPTPKSSSTTTLPLLFASTWLIFAFSALWFLFYL